MFARDALTPKGGFSPMIYKKQQEQRNVEAIANRVEKSKHHTLYNEYKLLFLTNCDPVGNSFCLTLIQSLFSKLKSFCTEVPKEININNTQTHTDEVAPN